MLPDIPLRFEIKLPSYHPQLLEGLDLWLRFGLISDSQVRQICREYLVCPITVQVPVVTATADPVKPLPVNMLQAISIPSASRDAEPAAKPAKPNFLTTMLQSLGEELSVRWLLFLGVFLVVVSSGVLAASQWEKFPASGQYGVLFAYTLSFWGFGFWAAKQNNLRLTAQTLLLVSLLLVPVNFWAMDSFKLWHNPLDWITVAIAAPTLTVMTALLFSNRLFSINLRTDKLLLVNILGLSFLHWGWKLPNFPLIAVYLAMIGTTIITIYHNRYRRQKTPDATPTEGSSRISLGIRLPAAIIVYALIVLLMRAIFIVQVDVTQLGLAIGICGWLMTWLAQREITEQGSREQGAGGVEVEQGSREQGAGGVEAEQGSREQGAGGVEVAQGSREQGAGGVISSLSPSSPLSPLSSFIIWERLGSIVLFLGWLVAVFNYPGQAIAVSGLALQFSGSRLQRYSLQTDFVAVFVIGLQAIWLGWRLVPANIQTQAIAFGTQLTHSQNVPWALLSIAFFPYLILMVGLTDLFYRQQKRQLVICGDGLTLILGTVLTTIALVNPTLRSLNLLLSTITLVNITKRRLPRQSQSSPLVYLTHIMGVLTLCSTVDWLFPTLGREFWASILLVLMVVELGLSLTQGIWRESALLIGLGLAAASYILLWANGESAWYGEVRSQQQWGIIWLVTPLTLTAIASRNNTQERRVNTSLSIVSLGLAQLLTIHLPGTRLIALAVATAVMYFNTSYLRYELTAAITLGFGLTFIGTLLWEGIPGLPHLSVAGWFLVGAIATFSLWYGRAFLIRQNKPLATIYAKASDKWAIAFCSLELFLLTVHSLAVYEKFQTSGILYLTSIAITLAGIVYRSWREPNNWAFYGIGWGLELLVAEILGFWGRSTVNMAIANIALGLSAEVVGEWWRRRYQVRLNSLHILPLVYAVLSVILRLDTFESWTGLCSLGVALIFIGVGRRTEKFQPLLYLGIIGVSLSAYELLFYQMSQAKGGAYGDALIAMATLGTGIMYAYRILSPWLGDYLRLTPRQLKAITHLHWAWSSFLLLAGIVAPIEVNRLLGLGTGIVLVQYAIFEGRNITASTQILGDITIAEIWVYIGLLQVAALRIYWRQTIIEHLFGNILLPWNGAIACVFAYFLYILPWEDWGWSRRPWRNAAYIIPLIILAETSLKVYPITLAIAACYYIFLAKIENNIRFTYISIGLIDWALCRWFVDLQLNDSLWYVTVIGLSLLYIAHIDPWLRLPEGKETRHSLRMVGSGLICGWAMFFNQDTALIPGIFSLIAIFAGLGLRIRAFLYVGTAAFLFTSIYQLIIFSLRYPFLKWVVGLFVGIVLISIAANFETRRAQISSLLRNTNDEFHNWQ
ncbi:DUF2157 domain-containing protein [Calothrix anomala]|uniref:DUF2157 domain-containing protein n=1 Tax=Calothrix anomala FACHB-343 TaxID=2692894 RepID=A0ABR8B7M4_9CYAN|nr:DUF2157 domain-containing protein [Calothrix anomala]MBD2229243.1 DUF2157 domain-containing protein [Calothrix anomala FACHB-343]